MSEPLTSPLVLTILDGWGEAAPGDGNAIARAGLSVMPSLARRSRTELAASGPAVGLPDGVMGNSEVGHLTIGAGRIIDQDYVRINRACQDGTLADLPALQDALAAVRDGSGRLHYFGLCSEAGVHSDLAHLRALLGVARRAGVDRQFVHCFTDGRDTPPDSGRGYVAALETFLREEIPGASVGTVMGRYWAMDRDSRWDRTERAYRALVAGEGARASSGEEAVAASYAAGRTDEFIEPVIVDPEGDLRDGDAVLFFNFRADRTRQLTRALTDPSFAEFSLSRPELVRFVCMTVYGRDFDLPALFRREQPEGVLGEVFAVAGWPQLRLAETEKYAHVTYFLNGGREEVFPGEDRDLVPSPRVPTYDETPAMSAPAVADRAVDWIERGGRRLLVVNFANADMVGHTGDLEAATAAVRVVDDCVGRILDAVKRQGGVLIVTADHGNAETIIDQRGGPMTAHTTGPVPFLLWDARDPAGTRPLRRGGGLRDVAPTVLDLAGLEVPEAMDGRSLLRAEE